MNQANEPETDGARLQKRFDALKAETGMTKAEFARVFKIPGGASMISQHISGHRPIGLDAAVAYMRGFKCSISDISPTLAAQLPEASQAASPARPVASRARELTTPDDSNVLQVPLLENSGSMGEGAAMLDGDILAGQLTLNPVWVSGTLHPSRQDALRFIHGYGDSMAPTFNSGDVLLVDTGINDVKIDGVYVLTAHDRLFIKRVRQRMDGVFEISSDNPTHKTVDVLNGNHDVLVLGRVIWVWNGRRT